MGYSSRCVTGMSHFFNTVSVTSQIVLAANYFNNVDMLPTVIPEILITPFKYWLEGIQEGMYHDNELFTLVKVYGLERRDQAYEHACELADKDIHICITVSDFKYCLWQNLRSYASKSKTRFPDTVMGNVKDKTKVLVS